MSTAAYPAYNENNYPNTQGFVTLLYLQTNYYDKNGINSLLIQYLPLVGGTMTGNILVGTNNMYNLGSASKQWANIYTVLLTLGIPLPAASGGTGLSTYAIGDLIYASATTPTLTLSRLADIDTGAVLVSGGVGVAPAWSATPFLTTLILGNSTFINPVITDSFEIVVSTGSHGAGLGLLTYGVAGGTSNLTFTYAGTSVASPSATPNFKPLGTLSWSGFDTAYTQPRATIVAVTTELWAAGANGADLRFSTTPTGTTTTANTLWLNQNGGLSVGSYAANLNAPPAGGGIFPGALVIGNPTLINPVATDQFEIITSTGTNASSMGLLTFGTSNSPLLDFGFIGTSVSSPSATGVARLGTLGWSGFDTAYTAVKAAVYANSTQIWAAGSNGCDLHFAVTPNNSTTRADAMWINQNGGISFGSYASGANAPPTGGGIFPGSVGIGTATPNASAILDVQSTTLGLRFPNMTHTQREAITNVAGNVVYDTDANALSYSTASLWLPSVQTYTKLFTASGTYTHPVLNSTFQVLRAVILCIGGGGGGGAGWINSSISNAPGGGGGGAGGLTVLTLDGNLISSQSATGMFSEDWTVTVGTGGTGGTTSLSAPGAGGVGTLSSVAGAHVTYVTAAGGTSGGGATSAAGAGTGGAAPSGGQSVANSIQTPITGSLGAGGAGSTTSSTPGTTPPAVTTVYGPSGGGGGGNFFDSGTVDSVGGAGGAINSITNAAWISIAGGVGGSQGSLIVPTPGTSTLFYPFCGSGGGGGGGASNAGAAYPPGQNGGLYGGGGGGGGGQISGLGLGVNPGGNGAGGCVYISIQYVYTG